VIESMATLDILANEKDLPKVIKKIRFKSTDPEIIQLWKSLNNGQKELIGEIDFPVVGVPPIDKAPVVDAGQDQDVIENALVTLDGSAHDDGKIVSAKWTPPDFITLTPDPIDNTKATFTSPMLSPNQEALGLIFRFEAVDDKGNMTFDEVIVTVRRQVHVPPTCPPHQVWNPVTQKCEDKIQPAHGLVFDSNVSWVGTVGQIVNSQFGNIAPYQSGFYTAASGSPKVGFITPTEYYLEGTGSGIHPRLYGAYGLYNGRAEATFKFITDSVDNASFKFQRNRHQAGGVCENRVGGFGFAFDRNQMDIKIEKCHNIHESGHKFDLPKQLVTGTYYRMACEVRDVNKEIEQIGFLDYFDGKGFQQIGKVNYTGTYAPYFDEALFAKRAEFWIRYNGNSGKLGFKDVKLFTL
jgi:K319-like protein